MKKIIRLLTIFLFFHLFTDCVIASNVFNVSDLKDGSLLHSITTLTSKEIKEVTKIQMEESEFNEFWKKVKFLDKVGTNPFFLNLPFLNLEDKLAFASFIKEFDKSTFKEQEHFIFSTKYNGKKIINHEYIVNKNDSYYYLNTSYFYDSNSFVCLSTLSVKNLPCQFNEKKDEKILILKTKEKEIEDKRTDDRNKVITDLKYKADKAHWKYFKDSKKR